MLVGVVVAVLRGERQALECLDASGVQLDRALVGPRLEQARMVGELLLGFVLNAESAVAGRSSDCSG